MVRGTAVRFRSNLKLTPIEASTFEIFEVIDGRSSISSFVIRLNEFYRHPRAVFQDSLEGLTNLLENVLFAQEKLLVVGDCNVHMNNISC